VNDLAGKLADPVVFCKAVLGRDLRPYQAEVIRAVCRSVFRRQGLVFTVMFARQMGKNEVSACLEAYLLFVHRYAGGRIVKAAPTFKPQVVISRDRLMGLLGPVAGAAVTTSWGYIVRMERSSIAFYSGEPGANVVGETADLLLEIDEAQDFDEEKYQRDFRPMASTANATTVLYGTAWSEDSLLETQRRHNLELERRDGIQRHFEFDWRALAVLSEQYRRFVEGERERLGAEHPLFVTQYELQALAGEGRLLPPGALAQLLHTHGREAQAGGANVYVAGLDVGGEGPGDHDETVLTVARVNRQPAGERVELPILEVVELLAWRGASLAELQVQLADLLERVWRIERVAVDATGLGAGVASFLVSALGDVRVDKVVFTSNVKSQLGYALVASVTAGRFRYYGEDDDRRREAMRQMRECRRSIQPASRLMSWGVPPPGHDDYVTSAALCVRASGEAVTPAGAVVMADDVLSWR